MADEKIGNEPLFVPVDVTERRLKLLEVLGKSRNMTDAEEDEALKSLGGTFTKIVYDYWTGEVKSFEQSFTPLE